MTKSVIDLYEYRLDPTARTWDLPPWGHVLSKGTVPLFLRSGRKLKPVGTAYWLGGGAPFIMTALHCVTEALREDPRYERLFANGLLPEKIDLRDAAFYILHQDDCTTDGGRVSLIPLTSVNAGPPGDVAFGFPQFEEGRLTWALPISFDPPRIGSKVWSLGYTSIEPADGISLDDLQAGAFNWARDYRHRFVVTEGTVTSIFTQRFATGFTNGPCFAFDNAIARGQSGGPIITQDGRLVGLNSASADSFFNRQMSLGSMFYPLLLTPLKASVSIGPPNGRLTMNMHLPLIDLIARGAIKSDGSETHVALHETSEGDRYAIGPRVPREDQSNTHADFQSMQDGSPKQIITDYFRFSRTSVAADIPTENESSETDQSS